MVSMGCPDLAIKFFAKLIEPALALRRDTVGYLWEKNGYTRDTVAATSTPTFIQEPEIHRAHSVDQGLVQALGTQ